MPSLKTLGAYAALIGLSEVHAQGVGNQAMKAISPKPQYEHLRLNVSYDEPAPIYHSVFPCYNQPMPEGAKRVPFPISNGRVQIEATGEKYTGPVLFPDGVTGDWRGSFYIGGFEGLSVGTDNSFTIRPTSFLVDVKDFEAGKFCGPPLPAVTQIADEPFLDAETSSKPIQRYDVPQDELDGLNATIAIAFVHFAPDGQSNDYMLTQVSDNPIDAKFWR